MRLGTHHVLVSLRHETDGSAVFTAHCPRTLRDAHVTVPADDPTLSSLIVKHGTGVIYHCDQFLILTEDASGAFQLRWQGYESVSASNCCVWCTFVFGRLSWDLCDWHENNAQFAVVFSALWLRFRVDLRVKPFL
jgi:hypothetical protein